MLSRRARWLAVGWLSTRWLARRLRDLLIDVMMVWKYHMAHLMGSTLEIVFSESPVAQIAVHSSCVTILGPDKVRYSEGSSGTYFLGDLLM
jgi:hypothetical protein